MRRRVGLGKNLVSLRAVPCDEFDNGNLPKDLYCTRNEIPFESSLLTSLRPVCRVRQRIHRVLVGLCGRNQRPGRRSVCDLPQESGPPRGKPVNLPREPSPYNEWYQRWPNYLIAYDTTLNARRANEQVEADPSNQEAKDNLTIARVAGYLLELFGRREILSETPCASVVNQLTSPPRGGNTARRVLYKLP